METLIDKIKNVIEQCLRGASCEAVIRYDEPMSLHTTFRVGGPADCWVCPREASPAASQNEGFAGFCAALLNKARAQNIPVFILGGGANIVVSDKGIRGIVLDMGAWNGKYCPAKKCTPDLQEGELVLKSGTTIDKAVDIAAAAGLGGIEFLAGMPGALGGALWMNARCYGSETADVLNWVEILVCEETGNEKSTCSETSSITNVESREYVLKKITAEDKTGFGYKKSPFQKMDCLILGASLKLEKREKEKILFSMKKNREDREKKGHYLFPCAGSVFKNNHDFGKPTGAIIDELGLKGLQIGGARIAPFHGNIIINTGSATAADIRALVDEAASRVKSKTGFVLEPEILFVGETQM